MSDRQVHIMRISAELHGHKDKMYVCTESHNSPLKNNYYEGENNSVSRAVRVIKVCSKVSL